MYFGLMLYQKWDPIYVTETIANDEDTTTREERQGRAETHNDDFSYAAST